MIDRRADNRQAERDVDSTLEIQQLARDMTLVMVHADNRVVCLLANGEIENRVGRQRPFHTPALAARPLNGRPDLANLFVAEQSVLACVRIQAGHGNARTAFQLSNGFMGQTNNRFDALFFYAGDGRG